MVAVNQDGMALKFASDELKKDQEVVDAAVAQNSKAKKFAWKEGGDDGFAEKPAGTPLDSGSRSGGGSDAGADEMAAEARRNAKRNKDDAVLK